VIIASMTGLLDLGLGATLQNLLLAVQNQVSPRELGPRELGAASSSVAFLPTIGVSVLGAVLAGQIGRYVAEGLAYSGVAAGSSL
jgi:hypothetical protein